MLHFWREAIAEVHSDFMAKLPDAEPHVLTLRACQLDGRMEGSRHPNLMLPWAQQWYGLQPLSTLLVNPDQHP